VKKPTINKGKSPSSSGDVSSSTERQREGGQRGKEGKRKPSQAPQKEINSEAGKLAMTSNVIDGRKARDGKNTQGIFAIPKKVSKHWLS